MSVVDRLNKRNFEELDDMKSELAQLRVAKALLGKTRKDCEKSWSFSVRVFFCDFSPSVSPVYMYCTMYRLYIHIYIYIHDYICRNLHRSTNLLDSDRKLA